MTATFYCSNCAKLRAQRGSRWATIKGQRKRFCTQCASLKITRGFTVNYRKAQLVDVSVKTSKNVSQPPMLKGSLGRRKLEGDAIITRKTRITVAPVPPERFSVDAGYVGEFIREWLKLTGKGAKK